MEILLILIVLGIIILFLFNYKKKNKLIKSVESNNSDREAFNKKYARQFRALGRKKNKDPREFKKLYSKMASEKKEKKFD